MAEGAVAPIRYWELTIARENVRGGRNVGVCERIKETRGGSGRRRSCSRRQAAGEEIKERVRRRRNIHISLSFLHHNPCLHSALFLRTEAQAAVGRTKAAVLGRRQANDMRAAVATTQKKVVEEVRILVISRLHFCLFVRESSDGEKRGRKGMRGRTTLMWCGVLQSLMTPCVACRYAPCLSKQIPPLRHTREHMGSKTRR